MRQSFRSCSLTIASAVALCISVIAAETPASKLVFENDHVRVNRVDLPAGGTLVANNTYDVLTVQLQKGDTVFLSPGRLAKSEPTLAGQSHYLVARSKPAIKNSSKQPIPFIQVEFLLTPGKYKALEIPATHYCNPGQRKACVTEQYLFCTDRFCVESVTLTPGAVSSQHAHDADHMVIPVSDFTWREEIPGQPDADHDFKSGTASYFEAGITHRLTNVGNTTAQMVVVQYK
jgi:quercetin dioxygenase-like cupin family protein